MTGGGFFLTARKVFDHPLFAGEPYNRGHAWLWIVSEAAWQDGPTLKRGQLAVSLRVLAGTWGWKKRAVERFIHRLVAEKMVILTGTPKGTPKGTGVNVITICNYDKYQARKVHTGPTKGTTKGTVEKEEKEQNKSKKENIRRVEADHDARFEDFWNVFPKRAGDNPKAKALAKFKAIVRAGTEPSILIAAARNYEAQVRKLQTEPRFIPMAITWLNEKRWADDDAKPKLIDGKTPEQIEREFQEFFARDRELRKNMQ